jgi:hypothetical protein
VRARLWSADRAKFYRKSLIQWNRSLSAVCGAVFRRSRLRRPGPERIPTDANLFDSPKFSTTVRPRTDSVVASIHRKDARPWHASGVLVDGTKHSYPGFNPSSILVTEAFLIEDGKIRRVEMIGPPAVYHTNSPWGGLSGD